MILGLGVDVVEVARIESLVRRHGERFLVRCYRPGERDGGPRALAERWAAKEAFLKAVGRHAQGVPYGAVEVTGGGARPVALRLHGRAAAALGAAGGRRVHVALAVGESAATAAVVVEG